MAKQSGRPFAVFDIDGTLIRWQLYHAIADELAKEGHISAETYDLIRETRMAWKRRTGETSFKNYETQVVLAYEKALEKLSVSQFKKAVDEVFNEYKDQVYTYTRQLIKELKSQDYFLLAISGSQTEIISKVSDYYGFNDHVGTIYEYKGQRFTGKKIIASFDKSKTLKSLATKHNLGFQGSIAVGDSSSDSSMMDLVETPIAFNPESKLFGYAEKKGWKIIVERKNMIYEMEMKNGKYQLVKTNV